MHADASSNNVVSNTQRVSIPVSSDAIAGTITLPEGEPSGVVIMHPATATPERYYGALAAYIASRGLAAVTYDYRGTGASGSPRAFRNVRMRDWMGIDVPHVAEWTRREFRGLPITAIGHSIGGHALTLGYGVQHLERFALVSSHVGATRKIEPIGERMRVGAILHAAGPALSRALGYMPGKRLGLGEDMPLGALLEWSKWVQQPSYFFDDPTMHAQARAASVDRDVLAIGASDDLWASPQQMDALTNHLLRARVERCTYTPAELGAAKIGHHGLLRRNVGEPVWPELVDWLVRGN
ncbi:alpha/beta hydrolase family protein [Gulosibacter molinativorax]|uniref:Esterase n=1 Tax=Gulosibacter molinativorax TaxID=256821 RepID=A0ABT7CAS1_9MICO|nr:alpha/beta fold hydrolase [Gulosibacter molinativorax]MDJ1371862.1 esterase [Gulosibacter molinativorax]